MPFHIGFASPWLLLLLLLLPAWWLWRRRRRPSAIVFSRVGALVTAPGNARWIARALFVLRNAVLILLIVGAARPRSAGRNEEVRSEGINIVIAFDISTSMLAQDFPPQNRLEAARDRVSQFVTMRKSDRIGLVAFSGEALTQVPLTTDYAVVRAAVDNLQPGQLEDGTAIGTAIATAANRLRDAPGASKVLLILTDGVNNRGSIDPRTAAAAAGAFGIKIYAIGVGSRGMAPTPVGRGAFGLRYDLRPVEIDEELLTEIAQSTGGRYYRATDAASLGRVTEEIDRLERVPITTRTYTRYTELYHWIVGIALIGLLLELGLAAWRGPIP